MLLIKYLGHQYLLIRKLIINIMLQIEKLLCPSCVTPTSTQSTNINGLARATVPVLLGGSQYFFLILDEFSQSYPNNGVIGIAPPETKLSIPSYAINLDQDYSNNYVC